MYPGFTSGMVLFICMCLGLSTLNSALEACNADVSLKKSLVWGPGLRADFLVPVRYIYVQLVDKKGQNITVSLGEKALTATVQPDSGERARIWTQVLDRHDGSYIVRFRPFVTTTDLQISLQLRGKHVAGSPYLVPGKVFHETCYCPVRTADEWAKSVGCQATYSQIDHDLGPFETIDMAKVAKEAVDRFNMAGQHSICHYKVIQNQVYRKCYGEHVGFNMFSDAILLSLTRKMELPDFEFIMNLGDWPLENRPEGQDPIPIVSWCGSHQTRDIVLPTYDITEATLEMMGRVSLDMFSVQANTGPKWTNKTSKAFWRGRDSRRERLKLVQMSKSYPAELDAKLTNMFFFPKDEEKYGAISKHVSFFDFFAYKYQINIDGTVAAYRLPYLLAGDSLVMKQDSSYYEHFYRDLEPGMHYVPFKHDISDLMDQIKWVRENDQEVQQISQNGQQFAREKLDPAQVLCYHVRVFQEYAKRSKAKPKGIEGFDLVEQPTERFPCPCPKKEKSQEKESGNRDEL
ncbi:protein O-glucosyltransferase 2 [Aplysia californica]|uniref:Protein O-glucosyltransferase 2 n=1 Tax=Aplysia californica TaxID=6500 RepID=A0ABM1A9P7_APLCA|nr:protein O-glucosyltransferase 2 [Aplysia californica]